MVINEDEDEADALPPAKATSIEVGLPLNLGLSADRLTASTRRYLFQGQTFLPRPFGSFPITTNQLRRQQQHRGLITYRHQIFQRMTP